jgi:hypothetical protein
MFQALRNVEIFALVQDFQCTKHPSSKTAAFLRPYPGFAICFKLITHCFENISRYQRFGGLDSMTVKKRGPVWLPKYCGGYSTIAWF